MSKTIIKLDSQIKKAIKDAIKNGKNASYPIAGLVGLEVRIRPHKNNVDVTTDFRHRYTHPITGKRPYMTLGQYPALTLADARDMYRDNMSLLAKDIDPLEDKEAQKQKEIRSRLDTLSHFIAEWQVLQATKNLSAITLKNHENYLLPIKKHLGHMRVTDITPSLVIKFITTIQKDTPAKGLRVKSMLKSILQLAKKHMIIEYNPASDLRGTLIHHNGSHQPAITDPVQFAELLNDIDQLDDEKQLYNKYILQLLSLTFVRVGDACAMRWSDIDWLRKQWEFKPQKAGNRTDMITSIVIPLAPQALAILKDMKAITGDSEHVFHNPKRKRVSYHQRQQINQVLNSDLMNNGQGYKGIHSPHGFRSAAKTMLMERLGYDELITELALGHRMLNAYGSAYNRMTGLDQRAQMMTDWANYLDAIKAGKFDNVKYHNFRQDTQVKHG